jgi:hypothetical protein
VTGDEQKSDADAESDERYQELAMRRRRTSSNAAARSGFILH